MQGATTTPIVRCMAQRVAMRAIASPLALAPAESRAKDHFAQAQTANPHLFDGDVFHLLDVARTGHAVQITGCFVPFRHRLFAAHHPDEGIAIRLLGVSALTLLSGAHGHYVIMGERAAHMVGYPEHLECAPGGAIDPGARKSRGRISLSAVVYAELREELGLPRQSVRHIHPFCLIENHAQSFTLGCIVTVRGTPATVYRAFEHGVGEYTRVECVPLSQAKSWVNARRERMVPTSAILIETYLSSAPAKGHRKKVLTDPVHPRRC